MNRPLIRTTIVAASLGLCTAAQAQWVKFTNQTATRISAASGLVLTDPEEKHYAWGDFDHDGDMDLVIARKTPFTFAGGRPGVLLMNENGVLTDRTALLAGDSSGIPAGFTSLGMADSTNTREIRLVDVNNDGWEDLVTCNTIADGEQKYIGHPRIYMNKGSVAGVWQGFRFENDRFPQLLSKTGVVANPRFCDVTVGDVTGDGYPDLYFSDYDSGEVGPAETPANDMDNKLLINQGAANPGYFVDESVLRMGAMFNYAGVGNKNLLYCTFGAAGVNYDLNGDGLKDVLKITTLTTPIHVAMMTNPPATPGIFPAANYTVLIGGSPYFVSTGDLNNDGKPDIIVTDDGTDKYMMNTGGGAGGIPTFGAPISLTSALGTESGFGTKQTIVDLNNDGWNDIIIADVDLDTFGCTRRTYIYHNQGNPPNNTIKEESPSVIPTSSLIGCYQVAAIDINGDGWKDLVIGRCNSTEVWIQTPPATLGFTYPLGKPTTLAPNVPATFQVQVTGLNGGVPVADSATISISVDGGTFVSTPMTSLGGNLYEATIPSRPCGTSIRYFVTGQLTASPSNIPVNDPVKAGTYFAATSQSGVTTALDSTFESGAGGWTVSSDAGLTSGAWEVAVPNGTWNDGQLVAPNVNHTPAGSMAFVTGNGAAGGAPGAADVDGGATSLISPVIDLAGSNGVVSYARWCYTNTKAVTDVLTTWVSNDNGANWVKVDTYSGPKIPEVNFFNGIVQNSWQTAKFAVSDYVVPSSQVKIKFTIADGGADSVVEGGIDDVHVDKIVCAAPCPADTNGSGVVNIDDLLAVINAWGPCKACPTDIDGNGSVNIDDLLAVINAWGNCP